MVALKQGTIVLTTALLLAALASSVSAQSRCPAGDSGCTAANWDTKMKGIISGETNEFLQKGSTYRSDQGAIKDKAKGVTGILKKCIDCSMDAISDAAGKTAK